MMLLRKLSFAILLPAGLVAIPVSVAAQSSPSAYTSATRYDAMGRVVGTIAPDPDGSGPLKYAATRTTYDVRGNVTKVEAGELASWQSESVAPANWGAAFTVLSSVETTYDAMGRKTTEKAKGSDGIVVGLTQYSYDNRGRLECKAVRMDPAKYNSLPASACSLGTSGSPEEDRITKTIYDAAGQVLQVRRAVGTAIEIADVTYSYTDNGKVKEIVDANGNRAEQRYDGHDRQVKWVLPSTTRPSAFNNSTQATVLSTAGSLNESDYEEYGYDANGNRTSLRKRDGSTLTYAYDALNRITQKTVPARTGLASMHTRDVFYTYDLRGLQTSARFDSAVGQGSVSVYDGFGRMTSVTDTLDGKNRQLAFQFDKNGNRTRITHPDGNYFRFSWDGLNRADILREVTNYHLANYNYDTRGNVSQLWRLYTTVTPSYDPAGRMSGLANDLYGTTNDVGWTYTRNQASQILSEAQDNDLYSWDGHVDVTRAYTTNGLNQYDTAGGASFCYDVNGNLTADGTSVYLYDIENRLVEKRVQTNTTCASLSYAGALQAELRYDTLGRLYYLRDHAGTNGITRFLYDGDALVAEYDDGTTMLRRYVHGPNAEADDPLFWYEGDTLAGSTRRQLFADARGSIVTVTNYVGIVQTINTYDEYGIPGTGNDGRFQYTGQAWLEELGMYYYKARIYSPTLGRFMQTDPIGYDDQFNLYAYVGNDPINNTDFSGENCDASAQSSCDPNVLEEIKDEVVKEANRLVHRVPADLSRLVRGLKKGKIGWALGGLPPTVGGGVLGSGANMASSGARLAATEASVTRTAAGRLSSASNVSSRTTRDGSRAVTVTERSGRVTDISRRRVKQSVPQTDPRAPAGTMRKIKFRNPQPGTKGKKRNPTVVEERMRTMKSKPGIICRWTGFGC